MTRFQKELSGELGEFWKSDAERKLQQTREDITNGDIVIDEKGIARNSIGRIVTKDLGEIIQMVSGTEYSKEATDTARDKETEEFLKEYREQQKNREISFEEMEEMRNVFGEGTTVVDVFSGKETKL